MNPHTFAHLQKLFMKSFVLRFAVFLALLCLCGCKKSEPNDTVLHLQSKNRIHYAKGLSIYKYEGYSVVKINNPWPKATKDYTYILKQKNAVIPDSLKQFETVSVPLKTIVVTSTTHIPSLEMLG